MIAMRFLFRLIKFFFVLGFIGVFALALLAFWYIKDLPDPSNILSQGFAESTKIYDRTGKELLYQIGQERRTVIGLEELPAHVRWATLVAEDADFYKHPGIDVTGILRAAWNDLRSRALEQGGSTITQQFVKNALLAPEKTFSRKFREIVLSFWIETKYTKDEIFAFYLNQIPYGSNAFGIEQASRAYFGKSARDLTIPEGALLAALPQRPSYFSPYGEHKDELLARKDMIINRMVSEGHIIEEEGKKARETKLEFVSGSATSLFAPHFVIYIKEYLEEKYGKELVERGGLEVTTTLDTRIQKVAQEAVKETATSNEKKFKAQNAALIAIDPKTGQILSMVGSRDWFDDEVDGKVNVSLRLRQPGSSFKPIAYATLFEKGYSPNSLVFDLPTTFTTRANQPYTPRNYDGKFHGLLTMRQALAQSRNVPAVKVLHLAGINNVIAQARKFGISTIDPARVDLALVLGGAEVKLLDLTSAYAMFANDGEYNPPTAILRVKDKKGEILEEFKANPQEALPSDASRLVTSILSDNEARSAVFGPSSPLYIPGIATATKTGTTSDFRDGWTMGYTPRLAIGVWAGNNDNTPTKNGEGAFIAGPIWNKVMRFAAGNFPQEFGGAFTAPPEEPKVADKPMVNGELVFEREVLVDTRTNTIAEPGTPAVLTEKRVFREIHSILYYARPEDPQVPDWEKSVQEWVSAQPDAYLYNRPLPQTPGNGSFPPNDSTSPRLEILTPPEGAIVSASSVSLSFDFQSTLPLKQVDVFFDGELVKTTLQSPVELDITNVSNGQHIILLRAFDKTLRLAEGTVQIVVER